MTRNRIRFAAVLCLLLASATASAKNYLHFTISVSDANDQSQREMAWITMVEMPVTRAYPQIEPTVRRHGMTFGYAKLAYVRGAALREAYSHTWHSTGSSGKKVKTYWHKSESDSVNVTGEIKADGSFHIYINESPPVLKENGSRFDPARHPYVFALPIRMAGEPEPEIKLPYVPLGIMYNDPNQYRRSITPGKQDEVVVSQFVSHLHGYRLEGEFFDTNSDLRQEYKRRLHRGKRKYHKLHYVWSVERSTSRRHPHWKRKEL